MMPEAAVVFKNIVKTYPENFSVAVYNLRLNASSLYYLRGLNGSGKSTLLAILLNIILPDNEVLFILGEKYKSDKAKRNVSSFLDKDRLLDFLTVKEYFYLIGSSYGKTKIEIETHYANRAILYTLSHFVAKRGTSAILDY